MVRVLLNKEMFLSLNDVFCPKNHLHNHEKLITTKKDNSTLVKY